MPCSSITSMGLRHRGYLSNFEIARATVRETLRKVSEAFIIRAKECFYVPKLDR